MKRQRGQVIVLVGVALAALFGIAAVVFDVGLFMNTNHRLQAAADAAAEGGVVYLPSNQAAAISAAQALATTNDSGLVNLTLCNGSPVATVTPGWDTSSQVYTLTVSLTCDANYYFGRMLNLTTAQIQANATAAVGSLHEETCPIAVGMQSLPTSTGASNDFGWGIGTQATFAIDATTSTNSDAVALCVDITNTPNCSGQDIGSYIAKQPCVAVQLGQQFLNSMAGSKAQTVGNIVDGFATRFGTTKSGNSVTCPDNIANFVRLPGATPTTNDWTVSNPASGCFAAVPILDPNSVSNLQGGNGRVNLQGFALFWINYYDKNGSQGEINGYFLQPTITGDIGAYDSMGQPIIRLIR